MRLERLLTEVAAIGAFEGLMDSLYNFLFVRFKQKNTSNRLFSFFSQINTATLKLPKFFKLLNLNVITDHRVIVRNASSSGLHLYVNNSTLLQLPFTTFACPLLQDPSLRQTK